MPRVVQPVTADKWAQPLVHFDRERRGRSKQSSGTLSSPLPLEPQPPKSPQVPKVNPRWLETRLVGTSMSMSGPHTLAWAALHTKIPHKGPNGGHRKIIQNAPDRTPNACSKVENSFRRKMKILWRLRRKNGQKMEN